MKHLIIPILAAVALSTLSACSDYTPTAKEKAALFEDTPVSQPNGMQQANPSSNGAN